MKKKLLILQDIWTPFTKSHAGPYASACCYYFLLSVPASIVIFNSIISTFIHIDRQTVEVLSQIFKNSFLRQFIQIMNGYQKTRSVSLLSFSFLSTVWSSAKGISSLQEGLRVVTGLQKYNFIRRRILGIFVIILLIPAVAIIPFLIATFGNILTTITNLVFKNSFIWIGLLNFPWVLSYLIMFLILLIMYKLTFSEICYRRIILYSASVALVCILLSKIFSRIFAFSYSIGPNYIGLFILFAFMVWIRTLFLCILYGAILCKMSIDRSYHPIKILKAVLDSNKT